MEEPKMSIVESAIYEAPGEPGSPVELRSAAAGADRCSRELVGEVAVDVLGVPAGQGWLSPWRESSHGQRIELMLLRRPVLVLSSTSSDPLGGTSQIL
jgi:hypothetical protein